MATPTVLARKPFGRHLPPRFCLGIPFLDDLKLYDCAMVLP